MDTTRQPSLVDLAQTLFASPLQPLDHPTAGQVHGTVSRALDTCGGGDERDPGARSRPAHAHPDVGLGAGGGMPFPMAGHRHRVNRVYPVTGRHQCLHPGAAVGLDTDAYLGGGVGRVQIGPRIRHVRRDQRM